MINSILRRFGLDIRRAEEVYLNSLRQFDYKTFERVLYFSDKYDRIRNISGSVVECGIGYSRTFQVLSCLVADESQRGGEERFLYGFDSFEGFPDPSPEDKSSRNPKRGEWKVITPRQLLRILDLLRLPRRQHGPLIFPGYFQGSLLGRDIPKKIAFLHLDVDLFDSYLVCLERLYPHVVPGGVVLFDEYESESFPGAKKAIDQYLSSAGELQKLQKDARSGKYFLVKT